MRGGGGPKEYCIVQLKRTKCLWAPRIGLFSTPSNPHPHVMFSSTHSPIPTTTRPGLRQVTRRAARALTLLPLLGLLLLARPAAAQVGIGTTAPDAKAALEIASNSKGLLVPRMTEARRNSIAAPVPAGLLVYQTDGAQPGFWYYEATAGWTFLNPSADNLGNHTASQNIQLNNHWLSNDGGNEGLRVDNAGRVGVGLAPTYALQVYDPDPAAQTVAQFEGNNASFAAGYVNALQPTATPVWAYRRQGTVTGYHGITTNGDWNLFLRQNGTTFFRPLTVTDSTGRVGIGTLAPTTRLTISPTTVEPKITLWDGNSTTDHYGFGVSGFQLNYHVATLSDSHVFLAEGKNGDGNELMRIKGNGRVGIGLTNPIYALQVRDTATSANQTVAQFEGNNSSYVLSYINALNGTALAAWGYRRQGVIVGYHGITPNGDWNLFLKNGAATILPLTVRDTTGYLGVATSAPRTRLAISPTVSEPKITLWDGGSTTSHYGFGITGFQLNYHVNATTDAHTFFAGGKNGDGAELLRIQGNGRVGIGTSAPGFHLHLQDTTGASTIAKLEGSNPVQSGMYINTTNAAASTFYGYQRQGVTRAYHFLSGFDNSWQLSVGGAQRFAVSSTGLVGVNKNTPTYPLHVSTPNAAYGTVAQFDGSHSSFAGTYVNAETAGAAPFYGYQQQGTVKAYHLINSTGDWQLNLNGGVRMTVDAVTGGLGLGTVNPIAKLHINGGVSASPTGASFSFFTAGAASLATSSVTTARTVAAYIEGGQFWVNSAIVAGALNTSSDQRIKRVVGVSDGTNDLGLLNQLRITDYRYIDQLNNTGEIVKKVIAQEVEAVLPAAVTRSRMAIPDVYEVAARVSTSEKTTTVHTTKAHGFRTSDQVRLYTPQQQDLNPTVTVLDAHTFTFTAAEAPANQLFVYGKYVDDFRSVDYDAIAMLNVSATQELARRLAALEQQNEQLREQAGRAEQRAVTAEATTQGFEARLREVEVRLGTAKR